MALAMGDIEQAFSHGGKYDKPRYLRVPKPVCQGSWQWGAGIWWRVRGPLYGYKDSP